jgi:ketosteroid isomerase-like protein
MPPDQPIVQGRDAALAWFESFPTLTEFSGAVEQVDGRSDLAVSRGTYAMSFEVDGGTQSVTGKWLAVWRKQPDGSWLLAVDAWNNDHPLPEEGSGT